MKTDMSIPTGLPARPKGRRVAFQDLDIQKEEKKANRGHQLRKESREFKKQIKMEAKPVSKKELEDGWKFLTNPLHKATIVKLAKGETEHEEQLKQKLGKHEASLKTYELKVFMVDLFNVAGVDAELSIEERVTALQQKGRKGLSVDKMMARKHGCITEVVIRNSVFRFHYQKVYQPRLLDFGATTIECL